jgi:hypothetical protein
MINSQWMIQNVYKYEINTQKDYFINYILLLIFYNIKLCLKQPS